jgi:hypothetical protein
MQKLPQDKATELIGRRHQEYEDHVNLWRRLQDSVEGGDVYRKAEYGTDDDSGLPVTNLIRHKREIPPPAASPTVSTIDLYNPGADPYEGAVEDSFRLRLARTPVPRLLVDAISKHLSRIYAKSIHRKGPDDLTEWWSDVDGSGLTIDEWMIEQAAELFLALGQIDLMFDHPARPEGAEVRHAADIAALELDRCLISIVLPDNVLWWTLDPTRPGRYAEALIRECRYTAEGQTQELFRHWDAEGSITYDGQGQAVGEVTPHPFGVVPIRRFFDRRRRRCTHVGLSRYEGVAELEREYYNTDSELILSNSMQAHATLQGPAEFFEKDRTILTGVDYALPTFAPVGGGARGEWSYLTPPKDGAKFIQDSKRDLIDRVDRLTCQTKPAGAAGSGASVTGQSGIAKELDQRDGNDLLAKLCRSLRKLEYGVAEMALIVLRDGSLQNAMQEVDIAYPGGFQLLSAEELAKLGQEIQAFIDAAGDSPELEIALLQAMIREALPGLDPEVIEELEAEARDTILLRSAARDQAREAHALPEDAGPTDDQADNADAPPAVPMTTDTTTPAPAA